MSLPSPPQLIRPAGTSNEDVTLLVNSRTFRVWQHLELTRGIEQAAATWGVQATARWPDESNPIRIRPLSDVNLYLGEDLVVTGFVDTISPSYSARDHAIQVTGRSRPGQLVDCSHVDAGPQFRNQTLLQIARALAAPYGIDVRAPVDTGAPIRRFVLEPTETVFAAIERLARLRQLLVTDNADGELVLTKAGTTRAIGALVCEAGPISALPRYGPRGNILSASASFDGSVRFSEYLCRSQMVPSDSTFGTPASETAGSETDDGLDLRRVLRISPEGPSDNATCKARATWEAARRAGRSVSYECTVQGWRQAKDGPLWEPNQPVSLDDRIIGLEAEMLITQCTYTLGLDGSRCTLTLAMPAAYELEPPRKVRTGGRRGTAVGAWKELDGPLLPEAVK